MKKIVSIINRLHRVMREKVNDLDENGEYKDAKLENGTYQDGYAQALEDLYNEYSKTVR